MGKPAIDISTARGYQAFLSANKGWISSRMREHGVSFQEAGHELAYVLFEKMEKGGKFDTLDEQCKYAHRAAARTLADHILDKRIEIDEVNEKTGRKKQVSKSTFNVHLDEYDNAISDNGRGGVESVPLAAAPVAAQHNYELQQLIDTRDPEFLERAKKYACEAGEKAGHFRMMSVKNLERRVMFELRQEIRDARASDREKKVSQVRVEIEGFSR